MLKCTKVLNDWLEKAMTLTCSNEKQTEQKAKKEEHTHPVNSLMVK